MYNMYVWAICWCTRIGIESGLKHRVLWVQVPPPAPCDHVRRFRHLHASAMSLHSFMGIRHMIITYRDVVKFGITPLLGSGGPGFKSLHSESLLFHRFVVSYHKGDFMGEAKGQSNQCKYAKRDHICVAYETLIVCRCY